MCALVSWRGGRRCGGQRRPPPPAAGTFGARSAALLFAWELADEMTHCRSAPQNIIRLCFSPFLFFSFFCLAHFQPVMSLSGVGGVVGTPREDIECELCAERLSGRKKTP